MNVLVTGNAGYIGSVLTQILLEKGYHVTGYDTDYYEGINPDINNISLKQITKDLRNCSLEDLKGIDSIIHLAALSNDPLGEFNPSLTYDINFKATVTLAKMAKKAGVKRFVFVSSQSLYGIADTGDELMEDSDNKNPITAYAKTKWEAECELKKLNADSFVLVFFRPSTVYGASPKLRCDIVYNNLLACAYTTGKIEIKSDGTPWRPVVHVKDVCNAFIAGLEAPSVLVANQAFNVGIENGNYTVKDIALAAQSKVKNSQLVFTGEHNQDSRTYRVSFSKILTVLKDYYKPEWDLQKGGDELIAFFIKNNFTENIFRGRLSNRLPQLKYLIEKKQLDNNLYWL